MQTSNPSWQRQNNLAVLTRAVWRHPEISRRDLAHRFLIDKSSISRLIQLLIDLNLVETVGPLESGPASSAGGRKRIALKIVPSFGQVWGLSITDERVRLTALNACGQVLKTCEWPTKTREDWDQTLLDILNRAAAEMAGLRTPLLGIGFAVPGWVDFSQERIVRSVGLNLDDKLSLQGLKERLRLPMVWENDANCGAWSCLDAQGGRDLIYVLGRYNQSCFHPQKRGLSIGLGFIIGGDLYRGNRFRAGEFRSVLWNSGSHSQFGVGDRESMDAEEKGEAFERIADDLARNLVMLSEILDSGQVILGGDLKARWQVVAQKVKCRLEEFTQEKADKLPDLCWDEVHYPEQSMDVAAAVFPGDDVSLGAARLMLDELFQIPSVKHPYSLFRGYGSGTDDPVWKGLSDWTQLFKT